MPHRNDIDAGLGVEPSETHCRDLDLQARCSYPPTRLVGGKATIGGHRLRAETGHSRSRMGQVAVLSTSLPPFHRS